MKTMFVAVDYQYDFSTALLAGTHMEKPAFGWRRHPISLSKSLPLDARPMRC